MTFNMLQQIMNNPMAFLLQRGLNIPQGMNNPEAIVKHLVDSGQISQEQLQNAMNQLQQYVK